MTPQESQMWTVLRGMISKLDPVRIENMLTPGTPDVNYTEGWIELKQLRHWPPKGQPVKIYHYTPEQRVWALRRAKRNGRVFMLIRVGEREWVLLDGKWAAQNIGKVTKTKVLEHALFHSVDGLNQTRLLQCLTR